MKKVWLVVVMALLMVSCVSMGEKLTGTKFFDKTVIKGQTIYIGQSQDAVEKLLGPPDKSGGVGYMMDSSARSYGQPGYAFQYEDYSIGFTNRTVMSIAQNPRWK
jgi:hypothetical protein